MDYYKEMKIRLDKYRRIHADHPKIAVIKMLLWNIYFLFQRGNSKKIKDNSIEIKELRNDMKKLEGRLIEAVKNYAYLQTDNLKEIQSEVLALQGTALESKIAVQYSAHNSEDIAPIDIVFITDDNYAIPTSIAISSVYYNANPSTRYRIHVLGIDLSLELSSVLKHSGPEVEIILLSNEFEKYTFDHEHVSKAALFKFNICDIFPHLERILYLDSDMLILSDLSDFFFSDLEDKYAAVVKDFHVMSKRYKGIEKLGLESYFNSGMMLLNLEKMRMENLPQKFLRTKKELSKDNVFSFMDQDTFNMVFHENVIFASVRYNFLNVYYVEISKKEMCELCGHSLDEIYEIYDRPAVLHIGGSNKPWNSILGEKFLLYQKYIFINNIYQMYSKKEITSYEE